MCHLNDVPPVRRNDPIVVHLVGLRRPSRTKIGHFDGVADLKSPFTSSGTRDRASAKNNHCREQRKDTRPASTGPHELSLRVIHYYNYRRPSILFGSSKR